MECKGIEYSNHAIEQSFKRDIDLKDVETGIKQGEVIKSYPRDTPYPSFLILSFHNSIPLHILVAKNETGGCIVVTVYRPSPSIWEADFKTKKK